MITKENNHLQQQLARLEKIHRDLLENISDIIIYADDSGNILKVNKKAAHLLGYSVQDLQKMNLQAIIAADSIVKFRESHQMTPCHDQPYGELNLLSKEGTLLPVEFSVLSHCQEGEGDQADSRSCFCYVLRDIRAQKALEKLKAQIEQRDNQLLGRQRILEIIFNGLGMGITLINKDFQIIKANRYIAQLFGRQPEDIIGKKCFQVFGQGTGEKCANCPANNTLDADIPVCFNQKICTPKGEQLYLQNTTFPIMDKTEKIAGFIYFTEDITQNVQLQNQLIQSERFATLGKFASCVTHDLRNPLTVIRNAAYYLKRKVDAKEEKILYYLDIIERETEQADRIVSDLLTFCRPRPLEPQKIQVSELLENLLTSLPIPAHITVNREYGDHIPLIEADPDKLYRVFFNIVKNAFDAMPEDGKLTITTQEEPDDIIITFQDTGMGISEKDRENLFEPFVSNKAKGIGLGLYICKSIVEQHQGVLRFESKVGKGTSFFITLPKQKSPIQ